VRRMSIPLSIADVLQVRPACKLGLKPRHKQWERYRARGFAPIALRCVAGRSLELCELADFSMWKSRSGQAVLGSNEFDRADLRRRIWAL
jgi:hypothetical protein